MSADDRSKGMNAEQKTIFAVEVHDYDECSHRGLFSSRAAADLYCAEHNEYAAMDRYANGAVVVEYDVDERRGALRGAWYVVLTPDGEIHSAEGGVVWTPDEPARWVGKGYDDAPTGWGELRQGFGLTRDAAFHAAVALPSLETGK